jgi:hypothetical protein
VILPRILDVGRAHLVGKAGGYIFGCPLDQRFLSFSELKSDDLLDLLNAGKSDTEVLAWIREHSSLTEPEIMAWSQYELQRASSDAEGREFYKREKRLLWNAEDHDFDGWFR